MIHSPNETPPALRPLSKTVWVLAYFLSASTLPFLCLRRSRAIGNLECVLGFMAGLIVHPGIISALQATDREPLQIFVILSAALGLYLLVLWQFLAGQRAGLWSEAALREWRRAGIFFAVFLALAFGLALAKVQIEERSGHVLPSSAAGSPP